MKLFGLELTFTRAAFYWHLGLALASAALAYWLLGLNPGAMTAGGRARHKTGTHRFGRNFNSQRAGQGIPIRFGTRRLRGRCLGGRAVDGC